MNIIDFIIIAIMAFSLVSGMHKGFITSTLALFGFIGAWIGAYASFGYLVTVVQQNDGIMNFLRSLISAADLFKTPTLADLEVAAATAADMAKQRKNSRREGFIWSTSLLLAYQICRAERGDYNSVFVLGRRYW